MPAIRHGIRSTYTYYKCKCEDCRKANADYFRTKVRANKDATASATIALANAGLVTDRLPTISHGTRSAYTYHGCKCDECSANQRRRWREEYHRRIRMKMVSAISETNKEDNDGKE